MLPYEKKLSKVDTLKLAISYISFLNELVTTGRNPAENAAIKRNQAKLRKTVVQYHRDKNGLPLYKYTLSWNFEDTQFQNGNLVFTRTWTPENPNLKEKALRTDKQQSNSLTDTSSSSGFNSLGGDLTSQSNFVDSTTANNSLATSPSSNGSPINGYSSLANQLDQNFVANNELAPPLDNPNRFRLNPSETEFEHSNRTTNGHCGSLPNSISNSNSNSISNPSIDSTSSSNSFTLTANSSILSVNSTYTSLPDHRSDGRAPQILTTSLASSFGYPSHPAHTSNQNELNLVPASSSNYSNYAQLAHSNQSDARLSANSNYPNQTGSSSHSFCDQVNHSNSPSNQLNQLENCNYLSNPGFVSGYPQKNCCAQDQANLMDLWFQLIKWWLITDDSAFHLSNRSVRSDFVRFHYKWNYISLNWLHTTLSVSRQWNWRCAANQVTLEITYNLLNFISSVGIWTTNLCLLCKYFWWKINALFYSKSVCLHRVCPGCPNPFSNVGKWLEIELTNSMRHLRFKLNQVWSV